MNGIKFLLLSAVLLSGAILYALVEIERDLDQIHYSIVYQAR